MPVTERHVSASKTSEIVKHETSVRGDRRQEKVSKNRQGKGATRESVCGQAAGNGTHKPLRG